MRSLTQAKGLTLDKNVGDLLTEKEGIQNLRAQCKWVGRQI